MSTKLSFHIRDGEESDIPACLELDHTYETQFVWQMRIENDTDHQNIAFTREHLPRILETTYPANERRIRAANDPQHGFLIAANRDHGEIFGYMTVHSDAVYHIAYVQDIVISKPYRHNHIGTRLLNIAGQWARERHLSVLTLETQTRNYPAIKFCQQSGLTFSGFSDHHFPNQDIAVFFSQTLR